MTPVTSGQDRASPFLRWLGGKTWFAGEARKLMGNLAPNRYYEPFLGSGAVFFALDFRPALLSDLNPELVSTYVAVRDHATELLAVLKSMDPSAESYYEIREARPTTQVDRAARFLYLNRLAFNGIYRVNRLGHFNVPYGGADRRLDYFWRANRLLRASIALQGCEISQLDFADALDCAGLGDLVYCDPVYLGAGAEESFARYTDSPFGEVDFRRLLTHIRLAVSRGATVVLSWPHKGLPHELGEQTERHQLLRTSTISATAKRAATRDECVFVFSTRRLQPDILGRGSCHVANTLLVTAPLELESA